MVLQFFHQYIDLCRPFGTVNIGFQPENHRQKDFIKTLVIRLKIPFRFLLKIITLYDKWQTNGVHIISPHLLTPMGEL